MNISAISHRCAFTDCYAFDENNLEFNLRSDYDVTEVFLIWHDPASFRKDYDGPWRGGKVQLKKRFCLKNHIVWNCSIVPPYKRTEYYFEIHSNDETLLLFENDFATPEQFASNPDVFLQYKMAWMNPADIVRTPSWVRDTVWYQIMPDRFCSAGNHPKRLKNRMDWNDDSNMNWWDFFGGDFAGVTSKLDYLKDLGVSGIYFTPIFKSCSNHKYNIEDYALLDPDFGTDEEMKNLVSEAHKRGIKIMIDAVFNHSGNDFPFWLDVVEKGEKSAYKDWFFVNKFPLKGVEGDTSDGRYFSFDFVTAMPKLNTNNPEVQEYFLNVCRRWVKEWNVDAIRFDVANEVSHDFVKVLRRALCKENPELFLLGEIWTDSIQWLLGDEYHSVMNYPFMIAVGKFFSGGGELCHELDKVYSLYYRQVNNALFNFLDTHDTGRAINSCRNIDEFYQKLVVLMTMQGTPCILYGTEIALEGAGGPYNRRPMPWKIVESGQKDEVLSIVKKIIAIRNSSPSSRAESLEFIPSENERFVQYVRTSDDGKEKLFVSMNASAGDTSNNSSTSNASESALAAGSMKVHVSEGEEVLLLLKGEASKEVVLPPGGLLVTRKRL